MRIQTNTAANQAYTNLASTQMSLSASVQKLSSGFRINRSADDVAGLAVANSLRSESRALQAAQRNATQASAVLDVADGAIGQISQILDRMRELAMQSGSANASAADRDALNTEFTGLRSEIDRIVSETTYQGSSLLDGSFTSQSFRVGTSNGATIDVTVGSVSSGALGLTAAGTISTAAGATAVLGTITASSNAQINTVNGQIGAAQNRLSYAASTLAVRVQNVQAAESVVRDLDVASEMTKFTKFQILSQAGTAMLAQANQTPQGVLSLLRG